MSKKEIQTENRQNFSLRGPEGHFMSLRDAMNRLFDESFWDPFENWGLSPRVSRAVSFPRVDIAETDRDVVVTANVPGIDPENIEIEADEDSLVLSGKIEKESEEKNKKFYRYEREYGQFRREIPLPARVDSGKVSAKTKNGVLTVTLPKVEAEMKKKIKVEKE